MKKQIIVIHGGDTFRTYKEYLKFLKTIELDFDRFKSGRKEWKTSLGEKLGRNFEVVLPAMPNKINAKYPEWKIWFEKLTPHIKSGVVLVGHSLGGIFLAKYLSENKSPKKIKAVFLVAAVYDKDSDGHPVLSFSLPQKLNLKTKKIYLYHSKDDPIVPFSALEKYRKLLPEAEVRVFKNKGHFNEETFPEIVKDIKSLY